MTATQLCSQGQKLKTEVKAWMFKAKALWSEAKAMNLESKAMQIQPRGQGQILRTTVKISKKM
jgi:hypothetical protein